MVSVVGAGSAALLEAAHAVKTQGNILVFADSLEAVSFGSFASASIARENGGEQVININAMQSNDIALLRVNNLSYGGNYYLGSADGRGKAYLLIDNSPAANIKIQFAQRGLTFTRLGLADADFSITAVKGNMLTVEGFRQGFDLLYLPQELLTNGLNAGGTSVFSSLDTFLTNAISYISSHAGSASTFTAYSPQDQATYIAYDLDGNGLTGLIKLKGYADTPPGLSHAINLPIPREIDSTIINPEFRTASHPSSLILSVGDIDFAPPIVDPGVAEQLKFTAQTDDGNIRLAGLNATANAYMSQALIDLTAGAGTTTTAPTINLLGDCTLSTDGLFAVVSLTVNQLSTATNFAHGFLAIAGGNSSTIRARIGGNLVTFDQIIQLQAKGAYAEIDFGLSGGDKAINSNFKRGILIEASSFHSEVLLTHSAAEQNVMTLGGVLEIDAVGAESMAKAEIQNQPGTLQLNAGANIKAQGDAATAELIVTHDFLFTLDNNSVMNIGSDLLIDAFGSASKAKAAFTLFSGHSVQQINGAVLANAIGTDAQASFMAQSFESRFSARQLHAVAKGANSQAIIEIQLGQFFSGVRIGGGDLSVSDNVSANSSAVNAAAKISLHTLNGDINIGGSITSAALFGNSAVTTPDAKISIGAGAGRMLNPGTNTILDFTAISGYGAVNIVGDVRATSADYGAVSQLEAFSVGRTFTMGGGLYLAAAGTQSNVSGSLIAHAGPDITTPTTISPANMNIADRISLEASGAGASADYSVMADKGDIRIGRGLSVIGSGVDAHAELSVASPQGKINIIGDLVSAATAAGSVSSLVVETNASPISIQGGLALIATGTGSNADAKIEAASSALNISESISVGALGEGSHADLVLSQGSGNAISVTGTILVTADSSIGSAAGATAAADLQLGKLGDAPIDIFLDAIQQDDAATMSLKLFADGGKAQLGHDGHAGLTTLMLGDKSSNTNHLLDAIDIGFSGTLGKAIVEFGVDQDSTTEAAIQRVLIKGFRMGHDELNFEGLASVSTTARTLDGFVNFAMNHFNTGAATGTPSTQFTVADVLVGGNESTTYLAYDHDGTGISAIITLEGVSASAYKTANGLG